MSSLLIFLIIAFGIGGGAAAMLGFVFVPLITIAIGIPLTLAIAGAVAVLPVVGVMGTLLLIVAGFTSLRAFFTYVLSHLTKGKTKPFTKEAFFGSVIMALLIAGAWYYWPCHPVKAQAQDVAYATISATGNDAVFTVQDETRVAQIMETLQQYRLHRTVKVFTDEQVHQHGLFITLYDAQDNVMERVKISLGEYLGIEGAHRTIYYKSYSIAGKMLDLSGIEQALHAENVDILWEANRQNFELLQNSAVCNGNVLSFTIPPTWQMLIDWNISRIHAVVATENPLVRDDIYLLEERCEAGQWQNGETVQVDLGSYRYYELDVRIQINGYSYTIELTDALPQEMRVQET